jgi:hypothetical protein
MKKKINIFIVIIFLALAVFSAQPVTTQAASTTTIKVTTSSLKKNGVDYYAKKLHNALMTGKATKLEMRYSDDLDTWGNFKSKTWEDFEEKLFKKMSKKYAYGLQLDTWEFDGADIVCKSRSASYGGDFIFTKTVAKAYKTEVNDRKAGAKNAASSISDSLAQEVHNTLMQKKQCVFYTTLSPKKAVDQLNAKLGKINGQGIGIQYYNYWYSGNDSKAGKTVVLDYSKVSGTNAYKIWVDKVDATEYYYCVKIAQEIYDWYASTHTLTAGITGMNDISDLDKVAWVDYTNMFNSKGGSKITANISYDGAKAVAHEKGTNYTVDTKKAPTLANLYKGTAIGVCEDYAYLEDELIEHWGIEVYERRYGTSHAWTEGNAKDYDGTTRHFKFNYKLTDFTYVHDYDDHTVVTDTEDTDDSDMTTDDTDVSEDDTETYNDDENE